MASIKEIRDAIPKRSILGILMFLACMFSYVIRTNLSITIVAMVTSSKNGSVSYCASLEHDYINGTLDKNSTNKISKRVYIDERYPWSEKTQGAILAAYFVGPVLASIPAGMLSERFGGSRVVAYATLIPALLNLLMPIAAHLHWGTLLPLRFLMGFTGSAVYPALHAMIARWVPPNEKGMFVWTMQGGPFGTVVTFTLCSLVINAYGWKAAYYVCSALMFLFYLLWVWLAYDTPDLHPTITEKEKNYIKESIGTTVSKQKVALPVRALITSPPFLTLLWAHFANMWGIYFISTNGPKYTLEILGLNIKTGGFLTGLPYIARLGAGVLFAAAGDYLRSHNILTVVWIRKSFLLFSHIGPGLCLIVMTYLGCNVIPAMSMLILALALNGAACQTSLQNHQDLAPNLAGSLYGIMNVFGSFPGFIIPSIVGLLINTHNGVEEWRWMFWISAVVFFSATILFWIFGSASIQPWNDYHQTQRTPEVPEIPEEEKPMTNINGKGYSHSDNEKDAVQSEEEKEEVAKL